MHKLSNQNTEWLNGLNKNKIQLYAAYKRLNLRLKYTLSMKVKLWKRIFHTNGNHMRPKGV